MRTNLRTFAFYGIFAMALLAAFAWIRMPTTVVRPLLLAILSGNQPGVNVRFETAEVKFPFGVKLTGIQVESKDERKTRFEARQMTARPALLSLLTGRVALVIDAETMGGRVNGEVAFKKRFSASGAVKADLTFSDLNASNCPWLTALLGRNIQGHVDGRLRFDGFPGQWQTGIGHLDLALVDGAVPFNAPVFGLGQMTVTRLDGDLDLGNGALKVNRVNMEGANLRGQLQGNIHLDRDLSRSRLGLRGDVMLQEFGQGSFAVEIGGTVTSPVVTPI